MPTEIASVTPTRMLTPSQHRAARALVGWSREDLAKKSGVGSATVKDFELSGSDPKMGTVQKWRRALEAAGVHFIDADPQGGSGVRFQDAAAEKARIMLKKGRAKRPR